MFNLDDWNIFQPFTLENVKDLSFKGIYLLTVKHSYNEHTYSKLTGKSASLSLIYNISETWDLKPL